MDEAPVVIAAMLFVFFVGHAVRIFEWNYDEMLPSIEEELERQAMDSYGLDKEMASLQLQGLPCFEDDEYRAAEGTEVAKKMPTVDKCV
ncbi:hypothetical protein QTG54_003814 [Skeletonema marinoi]|uniref:Uncharacterized protein n=1 Tax=Skeletonema marinoi TaxID=267567 RepID=A0AAD9DHC2_9STRA|nr:hypothetical protein QTG54_003814 [Skeletonema marinoi]